MTVDNVVSYELVLPTGVVTTVDASTPDLFFALKVTYSPSLCRMPADKVNRAVLITS